MKTRAVLYDFDGTLADSTDLVLRCFRHTMAEYLEEVPPDEEWLAGFGTPLSVQLARFARSEEEAAAMLETYSTYQMTHHDTYLRVFDGAVDAVDALHDAGVRLAIVTSKMRHATLRGIDLCGLTDRFDVIVTPEDVENPKPHAEPVQLALDGLGVRPEDAVFVGDSPYDIMAGRDAGVRTGAALWGPFPEDRLLAEKPDHLLRSQSDVLDLL